MKGKITLLAGTAIGYVLGTRAGRERYEQIKSQAQSLWGNPKVQEKAAQAQDFAKQKAPEVQQKVKDTVQKSSGGSDRGSAPPSSTAPSTETPTATSATSATQTTAPPAS
jgi:SLT domain-containing protein